MDRLKRQLLRIADSANAAQAHYQTWFTLRGKEKALAHYFETMDDHRYVDFFHASNSGHYKLLYIELGCAFDSDHRAASIRNLKEMLLEIGRPDLAERIKERFSPFKELVRKVLIIRSKLVAHKELDIDSKKLYMKLKIIPNEVGKLIDCLSDTISELYEELYDSSTVISGSSKRFERATFEMLDILEKGRV